MAQRGLASAVRGSHAHVQQVAPRMEGARGASCLRQRCLRLIRPCLSSANCLVRPGSRHGRPYTPNVRSSPCARRCCALSLASARREADTAVRGPSTRSPCAPRRRCPQEPSRGSGRCSERLSAGEPRFVPRAAGASASEHAQQLVVSVQRKPAAGLCSGTYVCTPNT